MKLIAVDWGSSAFRAYLIGDDLEVVDQVKNNSGVLHHGNGGFAETLWSACGAWLTRWPQLPVLMAGMIGSRSGWKETAYARCPIDSEGLSLHLAEVNALAGVNVRIIPGISGFSPNKAPDVMRGEEVQIFGAIQLAETTNTTVCLPGTHSKWVRIENGCIVQFSTFFTGEIFNLIKTHSSIGAILANDESEIEEQDFIRGVEYSSRSGGFLHHIFAVRAHLLTYSDEVKSLTSYLSGIAIGHEVREARKLYGNPERALVVGNSQLQRLYQLAAGVCGCQLTPVEADRAFVNGLCAIENNLLKQNHTLC